MTLSAVRASADAPSMRNRNRPQRYRNENTKRAWYQIGMVRSSDGLQGQAARGSKLREQKAIESD